jgi:hypothetical protein
MAEIEAAGMEYYPWPEIPPKVSWRGPSNLSIYIYMYTVYGCI